MGLPFVVLLDHHSLQAFRFGSPKPPSVHDAEEPLETSSAMDRGTLADYDYTVVYIPGEKNTIADAMSRYSFSVDAPALGVAGISEISVSTAFVSQIKVGYTSDAFCAQALKNVKMVPGWMLKEGLLSFKGRILVPAEPPLREALLHDVRNTLGHFGNCKTYQVLSQPFFWPRMRTKVKEYVKLCDACQRDKSRTTSLAGERHALPVPTRAFSDVSVNFIEPLPLCKGYNGVMTVSDHLPGYCRLVPCRITDDAKQTADRFFDNWHCFFGLPERIVNDRDMCFTNKFWRSLHKRLGVKLQMLTAFHPQTDGRSEKTNKTAVQVLRNLVLRTQKDWVCHLLQTEFAINAAVNE